MRFPKMACGVVALAMTSSLAWAGADEGKALYEKKCHVCHSIGGERYSRHAVTGFGGQRQCR